MSEDMFLPGEQILKINCHDPRCHQHFLQLSCDMHDWQAYAGDQQWWAERERQCLKLFRQDGYDLFSGVLYCLIACQRDGWKGIVDATVLLAKGFARQHMSCWPPVMAHDLRCQVLDNYCEQVVPLIYALPARQISEERLVLLLAAIRQLDKHAVILFSTQKNVFQQLIGWLDSLFDRVEQPELPARLANTLVQYPVQIPSFSKKEPQQGRGRKILFAAITLLLMLLVHIVDDPASMLQTNRIWPDNPLVRYEEKQLIDASAEVPLNTSTQQLRLELDVLEQRLLDAEQKRKPYMTISELKTSIYQMRAILNQQSSIVENELNQLQQQYEQHLPLSRSMFYILTQQMKALRCKFLLLQEYKTIETY